MPGTCLHRVIFSIDIQLRPYPGNAGSVDPLEPVHPNLRPDSVSEMQGQTSLLATDQSLEVRGYLWYDLY
jgi:hypothetical protein